MHIIEYLRFLSIEIKLHEIVYFATYLVKCELIITVFFVNYYLRCNNRHSGYIPWSSVRITASRQS